MRTRWLSWVVSRRKGSVDMGRRLTGWGLIPWIALAFMLASPASSPEALTGRSAYGNPRQPTLGTTISVARLYGLRGLFLTVKNTMESVFGEGRTPSILFRSRQAYDEFMQGLPEGYAGEVARKYLQCVGVWQEFERVASAVLGLADFGAMYTYADVSDAYASRRPLIVQAHPSTLHKDDLVSKMVVLGYAPKEIADVVTGRMSIRILDNARKMLMLGRSEAEVARYLEAHAKTAEPESPENAPRPATEPSHSRSPIIARPRFGVTSAPGPGTAYTRAKLDAAIAKYAEKYGVDPHLVRAVIRHESNWNPEARSRVGAIGLMQLMPSTARLLGVNPFDPIQNIEGGVRYLAGLLHHFSGNLDATLLGYIGGPLYAKSWLSGRTVPYGEVRTYLHNVKQAYKNRGF